MPLCCTKGGRVQPIIYPDRKAITEEAFIAKRSLRIKYNPNSICHLSHIVYVHCMYALVVSFLNVILTRWVRSSWNFVDRKKRRVWNINKLKKDRKKQFQIIILAQYPFLSSERKLLNSVRHILNHRDEIILIRVCTAIQRRLWQS